MFGQDCSAIGDAGAVMVMALAVQAGGRRRRTRGAEWRMMTMPSRWLKRMEVQICERYRSTYKSYVVFFALRGRLSVMSTVTVDVTGAPFKAVAFNLMPRPIT